MANYGIALDIGTSGMRCQALDLDTGETLGTAITQRHPIPGMNVIDHVNFAIQSGEDIAHGLIVNAANNLFASLGIDLTQVKRIGVCGNTFQMSLFENIEIRDLAYAGKNALKNMGVIPPERNGTIRKAEELGLIGLPNAEVIIPPASPPVQDSAAERFFPAAFRSSPTVVSRSVSLEAYTRGPSRALSCVNCCSILLPCSWALPP